VKSHHISKKNTGNPNKQKQTTTLKQKLFMKMQNHVEENLESVKNKRYMSARIIKYYLVSLFPNQVDQNTRGNSTRSANQIVSARKKAMDCTING
jgi:hypothetical protein